MVNCETCPIKAECREEAFTAVNLQTEERERYCPLISAIAIVRTFELKIPEKAVKTG